MVDWISEYWPYVSGFSAIIAALGASGHAILHKREVRAASGWVALIVIVPLVGALLYLLLGINRIQRKAVALRGQLQRFKAPLELPPVTPDALVARFSPADGELARLVGEITSRTLLPANRIRPLYDGDQAFPAMCEAIANAKHSVALTTYIFDTDPSGLLFVDALEDAKNRGVEVRVLIDAAGARYTRPGIDRELKRRGIQVALFMPIAFARIFHINLRNHRKILTVDGQVGFTGGMNIRHGHVLTDRGDGQPNGSVRDLHFRIDGPVVGQLQEVFAEDWEFSTGELLSGEAWFPSLEAVGETPARGISDGPDEDFDRLHWTLSGAIASARRSIRIVTPYFLPEVALSTALNVAALRGVKVEIVLPQEVNVRVVQWAMWAEFWRVMGRGVEVWLTPPPFDHTKLMIVDDHWVLFGSTNWDPRSLRLNFEFNVEAYDASLAQELNATIDERIAGARLLTREELEQRPLSHKLRDGIARLASPYL